MTLTTVGHGGTRRISLGIHPYNNIPVLPEFVLGNNPIPVQSPLWIPSDGLGFDDIVPITLTVFMAKIWENINNINTNYYHNTPSYNTYDPNWVNLVTRGWTFSSQEQMSVDEYNTRLAFWTTHHHTYPTLVVPETFYVVSGAVNNTGVPIGWTPFDAGFAYASPRYRILTAEYFRDVPNDTATKGTNHPTYIDLLSGYSLDDRTIPSNPNIIPVEDETISIEYYRENSLEPIPELRSIYWVVRIIKLIKDTPITLPITNCVLGTLNISSPSVINSILSLSTPNDRYSWNYLFVNSLSSLFLHWRSLYEADNQVPANTLIFPESTILHKLAANNNAWDNADLSGNLDINFDISHPMFSLNDGRSYNWHIKPQNDTSRGDLVMDSIRTIEIHAALDAAKWGVHPDDPNMTRVDNLGWRIERGNQVLGIRVKPDGTIDKDLEKTTNRRLHAEGDEQNNILEYNPNCFGSKGMLVRHLPNKFSSAGTVAGGYRKVKDIPQYLAEMHEQANAAMGYQEGTAIEIQLDGKTYRYPNQLALMTEIFVTMKQTATYSKGAFFSSLIAEQSIKEVMGGLGLRTVDKFLEFKVAGKIVKLYYKGISASQSIRRKLSAVTTNIGMVIGNII
jgi:hypothetical protein